MAGITFNELWEDLKNEDEESRKFFQTAEDMAELRTEKEKAMLLLGTLAAWAVLIALVLIFMWGATR